MAVLFKVCRSVDCADPGTHCCRPGGHSRSGQLAQGRSSRSMRLSSACAEVGGAGGVLSAGVFFYPGRSPMLVA